MANWNGFVLTHVGAELQAKVNAGLTDLVFTKVALGDGTATGDLQNLTDLVSRKKDLTISDISVSANVVIVKSIITNEDLQTGFYMREMGLYATDPDDGEILYAVMVDTNPDYMPADGSATVVSELLTLNLTMSNTGNVSATLDASQLIHRSEFFDLLIEKLASALPMTISSLNTNSVFYRLLQYALTAAGVQYLIIQGGKINANVSPITKTLALSYKDNGSYDVVAVQLGQSVPAASVAVSRVSGSSFALYHNTQSMEKLYIAIGW